MRVERIHERPQEFKAALEFTAAETGFSARLIEKDYWCSLLLRELFTSANLPLVFKGGTLLSKAFAGFDRLSEDLDFTISTNDTVKRSTRSRNAKLVESDLARVGRVLGLDWTEKWIGHNNSTQHRGRLGYPSISGDNDSILVEVSQREEVICGAEYTPLRTLLLDPLFSEAVLPPFTVRALSRKEAYAEKVRAALTREVPAIRDLYDLWQGMRAGLIPHGDPSWLALTNRKCDRHDLSEACSELRLEKFRRGLSADLRPVLRSGAMDEFPFPEAWAQLRGIHGKLIKHV